MLNWLVNCYSIFVNWLIARDLLTPRFVDDVEFYFDTAKKHVHMRSASRIDYSDLGVNRRRIEEISK